LAEQVAFEISHFCIFQTSMTMTLDRVIWHTVMYHSSPLPTYQILFKSE